MSATLTMARGEDGKIIHINELNKVDKRIYYCSGCNERVTPIKSDLRKKDYHFRHAPTHNINSCIDKTLHNYAVQVLMLNDNIVIGKNSHINYTNPQRESCFHGRRSDVMVTVAGSEVHFEVVVTHDCEPEKIEIYKSNKIKSVRIDLSDPALRKADQKTIEHLVLSDHLVKQVIYWEDEVAPTAEQPSEFSWQTFFLFLGLLFGTYYFVKNFLFPNRR